MIIFQDVDVFFGNACVSVSPDCLTESALLISTRIKKGLDLPIAGIPQQEIDDKVVKKVAVVGPDYLGLSVSLQVKPGDRVKRGQLLFNNKKMPEVCYTSPAGGIVDAINRGEKRALLSIVIRVDDNEEAVRFPSTPSTALGQLNNQQVRKNLNQSGLWTALRTRPFSKVPATDSIPHAIFVNAMDSNPLAPDPERVIRECPDDFSDGVRILSRLGNGRLYLCKATGAKIAHPDLDQLTVAEFSGPHPAGLPGTHIHMLDPVDRHKTVWTINYQDVIAIGRLFTRGELCVDRVISLAGPQVQQPRLIRTRLGAAVDDLVRDELKPGDNRIISGPVLYGHEAINELAWLGRYHLQLSVLAEDRHKECLSWLRLGFERFSSLNIYSSSFRHNRRFALTTTSGGEQRAMVPVGTYEDVMPLDILPTPLLRALIVGDVDDARALGCLELDEEDLALCTFVCPGKYDYGPLLRQCLDRIEKEG